jgi:CheY-like chemotaxis protein
MAKILVIDSNPEQQRALCGLIRYRTPHSLVATETCVDGARALVAERPNLIMINALMFMENNYAFSRVLQRSGQAGSVPVVVHTSGELEELSRRRIETHGVGAVVEMPLGAAELTEEIERALHTTGTERREQEARTVQWPQASQTDKEPQAKQVRPVNWQVDGSARGDRTPSQAPLSPPRPSRSPQTPTPSGQSRGSADRQNGEQGKFRSSTFQGVDPSGVKKEGSKEEPPSFKQVKWPSADPDRVKKKESE